MISIFIITIDSSRLDPTLPPTRHSSRAEGRNGEGSIPVRCSRVYIHIRNSRYVGSLSPADFINAPWLRFGLEAHATNTIKLKVGRAVNLVKRIDQWGKQCGSKEQVLRGWYPGMVEAEEDGSEASLMKGRVKAGEKGAWCHRLGESESAQTCRDIHMAGTSERLVHLELADLATTTAYLDPAWPNLPITTNLSAVNITSAGQPCSDCGNIHKEIFELTKIKRGRYKGKEWESVVKPVIERWGFFVETYV